jgi:O-antigen/teichoic acid export membrane protein
MGIVRKDAVKTSLISFSGLALGYVNKAILFILLFSQEQVGLVNLILTVGLLFGQLSNLGTIYAAWRFFPFFRNEQKGHYGFLYLNVLLVLGGIAFFSLVAYLFQGPIVRFYSARSDLFVDYYFWIIPIGIANVFFLLFESYMRGLFQNVLPVFLNEILLRILIFILLCAFALRVIDFNQFFILHALVYFLPCSILLVHLLKQKELKFSFRSITIPKRFRRILMTFSLISYVNTLATMFVISLDAMMIASFLGLAATGIYTTIIYLSSALMVPYRAMVRVSSPLVAKYWKERDFIAMQSLYEKTSSVGLLAGLTGFLLVLLPINELFSFIPDYKSGIPVFIILMVGRLTDMYCGINGIIFSTSKKYRNDLIFTIILCTIVFVLNWLLIPIYGIAGAAISTSFAYLFYNALRSYYVYHLFGLSPFNKNQFKVLGLFLLFLLLYYLIESTGIWTSLPIFLTIISKEILLVLGFLTPIYLLNLEPETVSLVQKKLHKLGLIKTKLP